MEDHKSMTPNILCLYNFSMNKYTGEIGEEPIKEIAFDKYKHSFPVFNKKELEVAKKYIDPDYIILRYDEGFVNKEYISLKIIDDKIFLERPEGIDDYFYYSTDKHALEKFRKQLKIEELLHRKSSIYIISVRIH